METFDVVEKLVYGVNIFVIFASVSCLIVTVHSLFDTMTDF